MAVETIGQAHSYGWRIRARCAHGKRDGMKSVLIRDILRETLPGNTRPRRITASGKALVGTRHRARHVSDFVHSGAAHGRRSAPPSRRGPDVPVRAKQHRRPRPINDGSPVPKQTLSQLAGWDFAMARTNLRCHLANVPLGEAPDIDFL